MDPSNRPAMRRLPALSAALLLLGVPSSALLATEPLPLLPYETLDGFTFQPMAQPTAQPMAQLMAESRAELTAVQDLGAGVASYYGRRFAGRPTASGERFDPSQLTAAHRTLPFGSKVQVTEVRSGKSVVVRINDRGPFGHGRLIDVSEAAARQLGLIAPGIGAVRLTLLDQQQSSQTP